MNNEVDVVERALRTALRETADQLHVERGSDFAVGEEQRSRRPRSHVLVAVAAALAIVVLGVATTLVVALRDDPLPVVGSPGPESALPDLGAGDGIWPGPDASTAGRMTSTDTATTFTLDVLGEHPIQVSVAPQTPDGVSDWAYVDVTLAYGPPLRLLVVTSRSEDGSWVVSQLSDGRTRVDEGAPLSVSGANELILSGDIPDAATVTYTWRDDGGVHQAEAEWPLPPNEDGGSNGGRLPMRANGHISSTVVVVRNSSNSIVFITGAYFAGGSREPVGQMHHPRADWDLRSNDDGTITVTGFNEYIATTHPDWDSSYTGAAAKLIEGLGGDGSIEASMDTAQSDAGPLLVTVVEGGLSDDSVYARRFDLVFAREGSIVRLISGTWQVRCQPGRGHQDFQTARCV